MFSGFWRLVVMLLALAYNSNLRYNVTLPKYEPEINSDMDVIENVNEVHVLLPEKYKEAYFDFILESNPRLYQMVI